MTEFTGMELRVIREALELHNANMGIKDHMKVYREKLLLKIYRLIDQ